MLYGVFVRARTDGQRLQKDESQTQACCFHREPRYLTRTQTKFVGVYGHATGKQGLSR